MQNFFPRVLPQLRLEGLFLCFLFALFNPEDSCALQTDLKWVEVEVALSPGEKAMVQYKIRWSVTSGDMGGFYFQGEQGRIDWHKPGVRGGGR